MSGFIQKGALVLVYIVVVYVNYLTITQSRNVLFMDDWGTPGSLFYSYFNNGIEMADFLSQHNESRPILSKIYSIILLELGLYSTQVAVYLRIIISFIICIIIFKISKFEINKYRNIYLCFTLLIVFIPTQCYNMLFGMTFTGLIIPLSIIISVLIIFSNRNIITKFIFISGLCFVCTFTYANGMIMWILLNPFLLNRLVDVKYRLSLRYSAVFSLVGFIVIAFYFHDYTHPKSHPDITSGIKDPLRMLHFFAILIWSPFAIAWSKYLLSTIVLSFILLYLIFHYRLYLTDLIRKKVQLSRFQCTMFLILLYGLVTCASIAFGRSGFGLKAALSEQYPSYAIWMHLAILGLTFSVDNEKIKSAGKYLMIIYFVLYTLCLENSFQKINEIGERYKIAEVAIYYSEIIPRNPFLKVAHNNPKAGLLPKVKDFKDNNLIKVHDFDSFSLNAKQAKIVEGDFNYRSDGSNIYFSGYAYNSHEKSKFDHILVYDLDSNRSYKPIFATTFNITSKIHSQHFGIDRDSLLAFDHFISSKHEFINPIACAVDINKNKIYKIKNTFSRN